MSFENKGPELLDKKAENSDAKDAKAQKYLDDPNTSNASREISAKSQTDISTLKSSIDLDPDKIDRMLKSKNWSKLYADIQQQSGTFWEIINNPDNKTKDWKMTPDAIRKTEELYNKLQSTIKELNGIIHGSVGDADQQKNLQMSKDQRKEREKVPDFQDAMKEWREWQERESQKKAADAKQQWDKLTGSTNPNLAKKTNVESAARFQIEFP
jgi:hypothetical protein